jgi:hypothetical protein
VRDGDQVIDAEHDQIHRGADGWVKVRRWEAKIQSNVVRVKDESLRH